MNKLTVFLDLDGVLVDWMNPMQAYSCLPCSIYDGFRKDPTTLVNGSLDEVFGGKENFHKLMTARSANFWRDLPMFSWAHELVAVLKDNFKLAFCTSPGVSVVAPQGKLEWRNQHFPGIPMIIVREKSYLAASTKVLIDDSEEQIRRFKEAGGHTVQWPNQFELDNLFNYGPESFKEFYMQDHITKLVVKLKQIELTL